MKQALKLKHAGVISKTICGRYDILTLHVIFIVVYYGLGLVMSKCEQHNERQEHFVVEP